MKQFLVVLITCPAGRHSQRLARTLVNKRLAACVNILPHVQSLFWWQGRVDRARESLLVVKTAARRFEALRRAVSAVHPYKVPEILALPIQHAHRPYLRWIDTSLKP